MNFNENVFFKKRTRPALRGRNKNNNVISVQRAVCPERTNISRNGSSSLSASNIALKNYRSNETPYQHQTTSSSKSYSDAGAKIIVAVTEGRGQASWEIGLAAVDLTRPSIILCQFADTQSYVNTLTKINILNASELLVPNTFLNSPANRLLDKLKDHFKNVNITAVPRGTFNKYNGLQCIKNLCLTELNSVVLILQHKYYALTAVSALMNYVENVLNVIYAHDSLKVEYQESEGFAIIDISTADNLELVASTCAASPRRFSSLFGILNHCYTKIGARTLRSAILQPPCTVPDVESRLDCVQEMLEVPQMLAAVQGILGKLSNIEQILSLSSVISRTTDANVDAQLNYILLLNSLLELITPLHDVLENTKQPFLIELRATLASDSFQTIREILRALVQQDAHPAAGSQGINQRCFAIKCGVCGLLDMVRKLYSERIENLRNYVKELGEKHNMPLVLQNTTKRGYHLSLPLNGQQRRSIKKSDLPSEFVYVERLSNSFLLKTPELVNMSTRIDDVLTEILKISNKIIHSTLLKIKEYLPLFYKLCEFVAKLDMLQSLAQSSKGGSYVRPKFREILKVKQSRHPLLEYLCNDLPVPNDVFASKFKNVSIITGPNGSGKSVYIRQILLLQVMAQIGCFVPAESATFRVADRILARVFPGDNLDYGASTFVLEIKEMQCFMKIMTQNTLLIIDELGRSTVETEGTALAAAIAEKLCSTRCFAFLTTHFKLLTKLPDMYYNAQNLHLETSEQQSDRGVVLKYKYNVVPGVCNLEQYGILIAKISWPESLIRSAEQIFKEFCQFGKVTAAIKEIEEPKRLKYNLEAKLFTLSEEGKLTPKVANAHLTKYKTDLLSLNYDINLPLFSETTSSSSTALRASSELFQNYNFSTQNAEEIHPESESAIQISSEGDNDDYYIHPHVVYSPNRDNITIQLPDDLTEDSSSTNTNRTVVFNIPFPGKEVNQNTFNIDKQNQLMSDEVEGSFADSMLTEDLDDIVEFSRNFEENGKDICAFEEDGPLGNMNAMHNVINNLCSSHKEIVPSYHRSIDLANCSIDEQNSSVISLVVGINEYRHKALDDFVEEQGVLSNFNANDAEMLSVNCSSNNNNETKDNCEHFTKPNEATTSSSHQQSSSNNNTDSPLIVAAVPNRNVESNESTSSLSETNFFKFLRNNEEITSTPLNSDCLQNAGATSNWTSSITAVARNETTNNDNPFNDNDITDVLNTFEELSNNKKRKRSLISDNNENENDSSFKTFRTTFGKQILTDNRPAINEQNTSTVAQRGSNSNCSNPTNESTDSNKRIRSVNSSDDFQTPKPPKKRPMEQILSVPADNLSAQTKRRKAAFKTPLKECDWEKYGLGGYAKKSEREIRKEFDEQSKKLLDSCKTEEDISKYMEYITNRPSVDQVQQVTTVAMIHKTLDGLVVLPASAGAGSGGKTKKKTQPNASFHHQFSREHFDLSILSDKNSKSFENFLRDDKSKVTIFELCNPNTFQRRIPTARAAKAINSRKNIDSNIDDAPAILSQIYHDVDSNMSIVTNVARRAETLQETSSKEPQRNVSISINRLIHKYLDTETAAASDSSVSSPN